MHVAAEGLVGRFSSPVVADTTYRRGELAGPACNLGLSHRPGWPAGGMAPCGFVVAVGCRGRLRVVLGVAFECVEQFTNGHRGELLVKLGIKARSLVSFQCHRRKVSALLVGEVGPGWCW